MRCIYLDDVDDKYLEGFETKRKLTLARLVKTAIDLHRRGKLELEE